LQRKFYAGTVAVICFFATATVWAQSSPSPPGTESRDCGVAWSCFEQALDQGRAATIHVNTGNSGGAQAPSQLLLRTAEFQGSSVTAHFDLGGVTATCNLSRVALRGIAQDAATMGNLSPLSFGIADQCQGKMFDSWWPAAHSVVASVPAAISAPNGYADCGWSTACLIGHIEGKAPAAGRQLTVLPIFGLLTTTVSYMQVSGFRDGATTAYMRTDKSAAILTPEMIQAMKTKGMSDADIAKSQADAGASAASASGLDGTCRMKDAALADLLRRWYAGSYSTDDWNSAETCTGKMFTNWHKGA
jgi:hypothetical protein